MPAQAHQNNKGELPSPVPQFFPHTWKILISGGIIFLLCLFCYLYVDRPVAMAIRTLPRGVTTFFSWVTHFGNSTGYLIITGLGFLCLYPASKVKSWQKHHAPLRKLAWIALFLFIAVAGSGLLVDILKVIFARSRPVVLYKTGSYGFSLFKFTRFRWALSFPSGHADTIFALMTTLSLINRRYRFLFFSFAVIVAISRVLIGAHFLSDILAGSYLGIITTLYLKGFFLAKGINIFSRDTFSGAEP